MHLEKHFFEGQTAKTHQHFENVLDPFNGNTLSGTLCKIQDARYGALCLTHVNGKLLEKPEVVLCTPKIKYPLDKNGRQIWPTCQKIVVYEKFDGTNVCCYSYGDSQGNRFVTYKTRLSPVLGSSRFGNFVELWKEILEKNPELACPAAVKSRKFSFSFEMCGYKNPHLIAYDFPLKAVFLFAVDRTDGSVCLPQEFGLKVENKILHELESKEETIEFYDKLREKAEDVNTKRDDGMIEGLEGYMFYTKIQGNQFLPWKCKPKSITEIHWATGAIPEEILHKSVLSALENFGEKNLRGTTKEILSEDYSKEQIALSEIRLSHVLKKVEERLKFMEKIQEIYSTFTEETKASGKSTIMRTMSQFFGKSEMKKVFTFLKELGLVQ